MENTKRVGQEFALDTSYSNKNTVTEHPNVTPLFTFNKCLNEFEQIIKKGGPDTADYLHINKICNDLMEMDLSLVQEKELYDVMAPLQTLDCMIGFTFLKPHGYMGDFELINRIYTEWYTKDKKLTKWDKLYHWADSATAVKNRKQYLIKIIKNIKTKNQITPQVLNLGSGPCTDIFNYFEKEPESPVIFDCIDMDKKSIEFAKSLCEKYKQSISFTNKNVFRLNTNKQYDLIWSAGLFDYFNDKLFVKLLNKYYELLNKDGELVVGNFSTNNPSRGLMEVLCQWYLHHRSEDKLTELAIRAGIPDSKIQVRSEATGINLFLHVTK